MLISAQLTKVSCIPQPRQLLPSGPWPALLPIKENVNHWISLVPILEQAIPSLYDFVEDSFINILFEREKNAVSGLVLQHFHDIFR